ncbi:MAG: glycosyltransferase family 2 protein, partial [Halioglobus sp.]
RWEHLNRRDSLLTECQAMMLDSHFALEQQVRYASGALFNFNGTAGIWRTQAILDAGNWSADTLTEDLDLSYRAQLKGWQMRYINHLASPGELPADMNAFKSQQHRWAKGGLQVMKKLLPQVWRSALPLRHKLEASFHLSNNMAYFVMLLDTTVFLIPSLLVRDRLQLETIFWLDLPLLLLSTGGHLVYFYFGQVALSQSRLRAVLLMPRLLLVGIQLAFNNAKAAFEALAGHHSEFVRTPKAGDSPALNKKPSTKPSTKPSKMGNTLYRAITPRGGWFEVLLGTIYLFVLFWGAAHGHWFMLPFLMLLVAGFFTTAIVTLREQYRLDAN